VAFDTSPVLQGRRILVARRATDARGLPFYGFKLLNAPPILRPDFLFIGFQPSGGSDAYAHELALGTDRRWPDEPEFATADWHLAKRMQEIFPRDALMRSMGSNVVFLRWPSSATTAAPFRPTCATKSRPSVAGPSARSRTSSNRKRW